MLPRVYNRTPRPPSEEDRLSAAVKVAARLEELPASDLVAAFLAATLGDVRAGNGRFMAQGYGFRAVSSRNRAQAVRNWMIAVTTRAATAPITP